MSAPDISLPSARACERLGGRLADLLTPPCLIYLCGELGAGKTTLVRGFLRALGYRETVKSPTYTLVEPYTFADYTVYHFDLYRLNDAEELEYLGFRDFLDQRAIIFIEWPERGGGAMPEPNLRIHLHYQGSGRRCVLYGENALATGVSIPASFPSL